MQLRRLASAAVLSVALVVATGHLAHAQSLVFDNMSNPENQVTGASFTYTTSTPNAFMGDAYTLTAGTTNITGIDFALINGTNNNATPTTFTAVKGTAYIWGTVNTGTVSTTAPAFSNLLGTYNFTYNNTLAPNTYVTYQTGSPGTTPGLRFTTPLAITSTLIGVTFTYQGTTDGTTYSTVNNLTSYLASGTPATVGSNYFNGYYRNANSETNGNFTSVNRNFSGGTNVSVALRVFGNVTSAAAPEPSAVALSLSGAMLMVGGVVRRRRKA